MLAPAPGVVIGKDAEANQPVTFGEQERQLGLYIIGESGMGKSTLLLNMILQDLDAGHGLCVLDPHRELVTDVLARRSIPQHRLLVLDPADWQHPFGLNLFACDEPADPLARSRTADYVMQIFEKLWGPDGINPSWGPQLEDLLRHLTQTFVQAQGYTLIDIPRFLEDEHFRAKVTRSIRQDLRDYWEHNYTPRQDQLSYRSSTLNKVRKFTDHEILRYILGQSQPTINIAQIMNTGKALLVNLPEGEIGKEGVTLLGSLITGQFLQAMLRRSQIPSDNRQPFSLYCDEYYYFATSDFARFFSEGRKFGLKTVVAHQARYQLDRISEKATLSVPNKITFRVSGSDAQELRREFTYTAPQPQLPLVKSPIMALFSKRHIDQNIQYFVEKLVRPLGDYIQTRRGYIEQSKRNQFHFIHDHLLEAERVERAAQGFGLIDDYLRQAMAGTLRESTPEQAQLLAQIASLLAIPLGLTEPDVSPPPAPIEPNWQQKAGIDPQYWAQADAEVRASKERMSRERQDDLNSLQQYRQSLVQKILELCERLTSLASTSDDQMLADSLIKPSVWDEIKPLQRTGAMDEAAWKMAALEMKDPFLAFLHQLILTGRILARYPIRERSVYGVPPAPATQTDVVTLLSNLPKYQARARLQENSQVVERTIITLPPPPADPPPQIDARVKAYWAHAHYQLCKSRDQVEAEIAQRQRSDGTNASGPPRRSV